jgi:ferredoxin-NADP reductase
VLYLSGGVGITPVMSMARWFYDTNGNVDMVFVHSARSPKDIIYHRELEHMAARISNFSLHVICEKHGLGEAWAGYRGYLNQKMLELIAPDYLEREIFCCGPTPYMNAVKRLLEANHYDMSRYHEESFGATPPEVRAEVKELAAEAAEADPVPAADQHQVAFTNTGKSIRVDPGETVHAAAAKLGLHIPKACGMGICGTCKVLKTAGEVSMEHNGGITDEDVAEGYILSCCSVPQGDVAIEY